MNPALDSSLRAAAIDTFEQVVFLLADAPPDETQRSQPLRAVATVEFSGPAAGMIEVRAGEGLLPRLTANMLGSEEDSVALQLDALGEIANIICGQFFPRLAPDAAFSQQPPEVTACEQPATMTVIRAAAPADRAAARIELGFEHSRAEIVLYLHESGGQERDLP